MAKHIVKRDELDLPAEGFKHVLFLHDEVVVAERDTCVLEELAYAGVGFFEVFGAEEEGS